MPSARINRGRRFAVGLALAILSLGAVGELPGKTKASSKPAIKPAKLEGMAVWYNVPPNSLARRRAGKDELTAAHNRLPLGTSVRVTHLGNGKSVVVRITDRGIHDRRVLIDLCREAAEKLDMLREGSAKVRLEILSDDKAAAPAPAPGL
jgi:rare lipoprotein A